MNEIIDASKSAQPPILTRKMKAKLRREAEEAELKERIRKRCILYGMSC